MLRDMHHCSTTHETVLLKIWLVLLAWSSRRYPLQDHSASASDGVQNLSWLCSLSNASLLFFHPVNTILRGPSFRSKGRMRQLSKAAGNLPFFRCNGGTNPTSTPLPPLLGLEPVFIHPHRHGIVGAHPLSPLSSSLTQPAPSQAPLLNAPTCSRGTIC